MLSNVKEFVGVNINRFFQYNDLRHGMRGNNTKLLVKRCSKDVTKYFFSNRIVKAWNCLPDHIVSAINVKKFSVLLDKWMDTVDVAHHMFVYSF